MGSLGRVTCTVNLIPTPDISESKSLYCPNIYTVLVGFLQKQSSVPGGGGLQNPELPIYLELQSSVLPFFLEKNMMMMDRRGVIE